ncbi:MAG: hypothetical protein Q7S20_08835 [Gemmatimonadaceae bacterium]|nr:hypothetical protein [Gemmatimonadaceae bacterium]
MLPLSENALDDLVARERERGAPPLTNWDSLAVQLRAEGLIRDSAVSRFAGSTWMRVAAGLALAVGGAAVGRASAGASLMPARVAQTASSDVTPATATAPQFKSPGEAWDVLNRAGEEYQRASAYLSASNTEVPMPANPSQYRTRLAALDGVMTEIRGALKEAPEDPVINQYYLATVGAREATLRQLGTTLRPAGVSLNRF